MACSRNQGSVLCFCAALQEEGMDIPAAAEEGMRTVDCLEEDHEVEGRRRQKRRELFLCLPPSTASAAAAAATCDAYSPRGLISRLLLPLRWPSPARYGGGGDVGEAVGCLLPFPKCGSGSRKGRERRMGGKSEKAEVDDRVKAAENPAVSGMSEMCARAERKNGCPKSSPEPAIVSGKKNEVPLNLMMGVGLVFLLARSATEINKMVELREQMEILLEDIKDNVQKKDASYNDTTDSINPSSSVSNNSRNHENLSDYNFFQDSKEAAPGLEAEAQSMYAIAGAPAVRRCPEMDRMEAELQVELERLQCAMEGGKVSSPRTESVPEDAHFPESFFDGSSAEGYEQRGVSAHELTQRLNQLLEVRRQEGVAELESSFDSSDLIDDCSKVGEEVMLELIWK